MSKLSFRARNLDLVKRMPVFLADELPDLSEYAAINRSVPQMPSGMEKEEEMEYHLQQAITAQQASTLGTIKSPDDAGVIPIPRVEIDPKYEALYHNNYKPPKQLIRVQAALSLEPEYPEYDLDTEDEHWVINDGRKLEITPLQFERIMDILEKQSEYKVISVEHAKLLLQEEDDDVVFAIYDYWLKKRVKAQGKRLMPKVRIERREAVALIADPYVGFRRRAEKMQTRKNRKNDEESYEKILKLRNDLQKALTLLEMVKRREKSKRELIKLELEVAGKRRDMKDFGCEIYIQLKQEVKPSFQFTKEEMLIGRSRRQSSRRRRPREDRDLVSREWLLENAEQWHRPALFPSTSLTSPLRQIRSPLGFSATATDLGDANLPGSLSAAEKHLTDPAVDGPFAMKRRRGCVYLAPAVDEKFLRFSDVTGYNKSATTAAPPPTSSRRCWPWHQRRPPFGYAPCCLSRRTSSTTGADHDQSPAPDGTTFVGLVRRRVGRGGRILLDRLNRPNDSRLEPHIDHRYYEILDKPSTSSENVGQIHNVDRNDAFRSIVSNRMPYYYPSARTFDFIDDSTPAAPDGRFAVAGPPARSPAASLLNNPDSTSPSQASLNEQTMEQQQIRRPCAVLSGPGGRARLALNVGVSADIYSTAKRTLHHAASSRTSSSPMALTSATLTLDSRRAFEAAAAVMTVEQLWRLTQRYEQRQSPPAPAAFKSPYESPVTSLMASTLSNRDDSTTSSSSLRGFAAVKPTTTTSPPGGIPTTTSPSGVAPTTSTMDDDDDRSPPTDPSTPSGLPPSFNGVGDDDGSTATASLNDRRRRRRRSPPPDPTPDGGGGLDDVTFGGVDDENSQRRKMARVSLAQSLTFTTMEQSSKLNGGGSTASTTTLTPTSGDNGKTTVVTAASDLFNRDIKRLIRPNLHMLSPS